MGEKNAQHCVQGQTKNNLSFYPLISTDFGHFYEENNPHCVDLPHPEKKQ